MAPSFWPYKFIVLPFGRLKVILGVKFQELSTTWWTNCLILRNWINNECRFPRSVEADTFFLFLEIFLKHHMPWNFFWCELNIIALGLVLKVGVSVRHVELYEPFWRRARSFSTQVAFFYEKQVKVETCREEDRSRQHICSHKLPCIFSLDNPF